MAEREDCSLKSPLGGTSTTSLGLPRFSSRPGPLCGRARETGQAAALALRWGFELMIITVSICDRVTHCTVVTRSG